MIKSRLAWMLCLLATSLILFPTPARSEEQLTPQQIVSSIDPTLWYPGLQVRDALQQVIQIGVEEAKQGMEEAVKKAVAPLLADKAQLTSERDGYKAAFESDQAKLGFWQAMTWSTSGAAVGALAGALMGKDVGSSLLGAALGAGGGIFLHWLGGLFWPP